MMTMENRQLLIHLRRGIARVAGIQLRGNVSVCWIPPSTKGDPLAQAGYYGARCELGESEAIEYASMVKCSTLPDVEVAIERVGRELRANINAGKRATREWVRSVVEGPAEP